MYALRVESDSEDMLNSVKQGYTAYTELLKNKHIRGIIHNMIRKELGTSNADDLTIEAIIELLKDDLYKHDYNESRAWNEEALKQMSLENYIIQRATYAIRTYKQKQHQQKFVNTSVVNKNEGYNINVVSLDNKIKKSNEDSSTLADVTPDTKVNITCCTDSVNEDKAIKDLVDRITRFSEYTDTNTNVIIYAMTLLELLLNKSNCDESTALKTVLQALGITNYVSMKEFMHDEEFIELYQDAADISNKRKFVSLLGKNIFAIKEITATIKWVADSINNS